MTKINEYWIEYEGGEHCVHAHPEEEAIEYVRENVSEEIQGVNMVGERPVESVPDWIDGQSTVVLN